MTTPLWVLRTAFRTAEEAFLAAAELVTRGLGHRTILRDPEVIRRTVDLLRSGVDE